MTKFPKNKKWGYHEWFHVSVLMGNLVSMGFDLGIVGLYKPCAEGVACASLASRRPHRGARRPHGGVLQEGQRVLP